MFQKKFGTQISNQRCITNHPNQSWFKPSQYPKSSNKFSLSDHPFEIKKPNHPILTYTVSVTQVWEGVNVCHQGRSMLGVSNPLACFPGQIRGDFVMKTQRKIIGGSDDAKSAEREIPLWFKDSELVKWNPAVVNWTHEANE